MTRITFTDATGEEVEVETDLSGMVLTLANDASKADHRHFHVGFDPASGPETSVIYVVDAGGAYHILPESEAREWEADGHTIRKLPPKKPGEFAPDHAYNLPKLAAHHETCPPKAADLFLHGPNEGRQAPPRREWWAGSAPDAPPPGFRWMGCRHKQQTKQKVSKRKAQKQARKANRSKK